MIYLFEHQNKVYYGNASQTDALEQFIQLIWQKRKVFFLYQHSYVFFDANKIGKVTQAFLNIDRNNHIQAKNYIGMLQFEGKSLHFLPKLFYTKNEEAYPFAAKLSQMHLIWWLSYSQKLHFPFSLSQLDTFVKNDFSLNEVLIFHFAQFCLQQLSQQGTYKDFYTTTDNKSYVKGKIVTHLYISQQISKSQYHIIPCRYATHGHTNLFNIIVKNVCLQLLNFTKLQRTKNILKKIIAYFHFLPVQHIRLESCEQVKINPIFRNWNIVFDYCKLFLSHLQYIEADNKKQKKSAMAFLVPTDILFEHFVYGFLKKHFPIQKIIYQDNSTFLATDSQQRPIFRLKQDLVIEKNDGSLIVLDTKYKMIEIENGVAKGISQADLYQMTAYAVRRKCRELILIYPNIFDDKESSLNPNNFVTYYMKDNFVTYYMKEEFSQTDIKISIVKIPFAISPSVFNGLQAVSQQFEGLEKNLKNIFSQLLFS